MTSIAHSYIPEVHPLYNSSIRTYPYDPDQGMALLDEIGWVDHDNNSSTPRVYQGNDRNIPQGTRLEFWLETTTATQRQQATAITAESMAACGFQVNLEYHPASEWFSDGPEGKLFGRRFDLGQFAWLTSADPPCELYLSENIPGAEEDGYPAGWYGYNNTGYRSEEFDVLCQMAMQALPGTPEYEEAHRAAQELIAWDVPTFPLYLRNKLVATRSDFCGLVVDPSEQSEFWNIEEFDYGDCN
jgi:peptide/nickel transport system substrate-binding protein